MSMGFPRLSWVASLLQYGVLLILVEPEHLGAVVAHRHAMGDEYYGLVVMPHDILQQLAFCFGVES